MLDEAVVPAWVEVPPPVVAPAALDVPVAPDVRAPVEDDEPEPHPATRAPTATAQSPARPSVRAARANRFKRLIIGRNGSWPRADKVGAG